MLILVFAVVVGRTRCAPCGLGVLVRCVHPHLVRFASSSCSTSSQFQVFFRVPLLAEYGGHLFVSKLSTIFFVILGYSLDFKSECEYTRLVLKLICICVKRVKDN